MPTLLRVDASARADGSFSRHLGDGFEQAWRGRHTDGNVIHRDLMNQPVPQIESATITAFYTPAESMTDELRRASALSDELIAELVEADALLITTPMYNFGIPAALKAWIDQIVRIGHTFSYDGANFEGLVTGKPVTFVIAYGAGGYGAGGPMQPFDFARIYLEHLFSFLGFTDIRVVTVEATTGDAEALEIALADARSSITALAA